MKIETSIRVGAVWDWRLQKKLIEFQGGNISAHSIVGKGSTFRFTLPVSEIKPELRLKTVQSLRTSFFEKPDVQSHPQNIEQAYNNSAIATILVVDDDLVNLKVVSNHLSALNINLLQATDGIKALKQIEKYGRPDLILLDIMMPNMSGFEFCKKIRERFPLFDLPIIFLTAKNQVENLEKGFEIGGNDYLIKPFSQGELVSRVHNQLQLLQARDKLYSLRNLSEGPGKMRK